MNEDRNTNFQAKRLGRQLLNNSVVGRWCVVGDQKMFVELIYVGAPCPYLLGCKAHLTVAKAGVLPESGDQAHLFCCVQVSHKDMFHQEDPNSDILCGKISIHALQRVTATPFNRCGVTFYPSALWACYWRIPEVPQQPPIHRTWHYRPCCSPGKALGMFCAN